MGLFPEVNLTKPSTWLKRFWTLFWSAWLFAAMPVLLFLPGGVVGDGARVDVAGGDAVHGER